MKARVSYNDFTGTVAADISNHISGYHGDNLKSIAHHLGLNQQRFELIGMSIYSTDNFSVSLLCIDKEQQKDGKNLIVSMMFDGDEELVKLENLFSKLNIVIHEKYDDINPSLDYSKEVRFSDFHEVVEN